MVGLMTTTDFLVDRDDISQVTIAERDVPVPGEGEVLLEIERFGLSANNITYAVLGDAMGYWKFFPADEGFGSVPIWGHAIVVESNNPEIEAGARYFGYFPLSTHLVVKPERVGASGFVDGAAHRAELPPVYQRYMRVPAESIPGSPDEDQLSLWRPLYTTSFGVADFINANEGFGATTAVLTSGSSKTALASAFCLKHAGSELELVGLTSPRNVEFCEKTGYYDRVVSYDDLESIGDSPIVVIDFAGNDETLDGIAEFAGDQLKRTVIVGVTHWQDRESSLTEMAPGREFFFLPSWIIKRQEDWGPTEFIERSEKTWEDFAPTVNGWLEIEEHTGLDEITAAYQSVLSGESKPDVGHILEFN
jgi:NADPH:quinone reductase-like Zn-dependent oxidoreductase